ncbi:putative transposase YkgN [Aeromonas caviae]|nr:putative transposase YkgN [Aeromonas caviae]
MSKQQRYTEEFKLAAVKQVTERNYPVAEVAERLGISSHSLYVWIKRYSQPEAQQQDDSSQQAEIRRPKAELRRVTDERDILKKAAVDSTCQRNTLLKDLYWRFKFQGFPRPAV